jgi:poly(3-hydroxybutyrate) depolymerase
MRKSLLLILIIFASAGHHPAFAARRSVQAEPQTELPKGQVIEKVTCLKDARQSYALYLPSNYTRARKWPILFAFDPSAGGKTPVEHYKEAAEKFGWIVVGSNNSRNGPPNPSVDSWNAIFADIQTRFTIDDSRTYSTGLSGGARMAVLLANHCGCIVGVIGSGAGFPSGLTPSPALKFIYFGTIGVDDFNFPEVKGLDNALAQAGIVHRLEIFTGRHEWPPSSVAIDALEWMELQAIKAGQRPRDAALVESAWRRWTEQASALESSKHSYDAYQIYSGLAETFKGLRDISEVEKKLTEMRGDRDVKAAIREEQQEITKQRETEALIRALLNARQQSEGRDQNERPQIPESQNSREAPLDAHTRLQAVLDRLQKAAKEPNDSSDRRVARRVLDGTFIGLFEAGLNLLETQKRFSEAAGTFRLATEVYPERAGPFFYLAWAYAAGGERKKSLQALKTAASKGFTDLAAINETKAFDSIRNDPQFEQVIQLIKKPSSSP